MAHRGWRRFGAHFSCYRKILDSRLERLSTVFRRRVQSRSRRRLLALGSAHCRCRLHHERHQLSRHYSQVPCAGNASLPHAGFHLDCVRDQYSYDFRVTGTHCRLRPARPRPDLRYALFHQCHGRQHDALRQPILVVGAS